jgi:hypothetical protein
MEISQCLMRTGRNLKLSDISAYFYLINSPSIVLASTNREEKNLLRNSLLHQYYHMQYAWNFLQLMILVLPELIIKSNSLHVFSFDKKLKCYKWLTTIHIQNLYSIRRFTATEVGFNSPTNQKFKYRN